MKFQEMKPGIAYNVTKKSTDGTFQVGDVIAIVPKDKSILLMGAGGWLDNSDYLDLPEVTDFECVVDKEHYFWQDQVRAGFKEIPRPGTTRFSWDDQLDAIAEEQKDVVFPENIVKEV